MQKKKIVIPGNEPALTVYDRLMRHRDFTDAARVARDHGLGDRKVIEAAYKAFCRFDELDERNPGMGFGAVALQIAAEFGLKAFEIPEDQYLLVLQALGEIPADIPRHAMVRGNGTLH